MNLSFQLRAWPNKLCPLRSNATSAARTSPARRSIGTSSPSDQMGSAKRVSHARSLARERTTQPIEQTGTRETRRTARLIQKCGSGAERAIAKSSARNSATTISATSKRSLFEIASEKKQTRARSASAKNESTGRTSKLNAPGVEHGQRLIPKSFRRTPINTERAEKQPRARSQRPICSLNTKSSAARASTVTLASTAFIPSITTSLSSGAERTTPVTSCSPAKPVTAPKKTSYLNTSPRAPNRAANPLIRHSRDTARPGSGKAARTNGASNFSRSCSRRELFLSHAQTRRADPQES